MAGISAYHAKQLLDFGLASTGTTPAAHFVGLSLGTPSSVSASEMGTGEGVTRQTVVFPAAASPAGSASNSAAMTFGPFSSARTVQGLQVWDTSGTAGSFLWYGLLATARTLGVGDSLVFNSGALVVTLA